MDLERNDEKAIRSCSLAAMTNIQKAKSNMMCISNDLQSYLDSLFRRMGIKKEYIEEMDVAAPATFIHYINVYS